MQTHYDVGDTVTLSVSLTDDDGDAIDATVTLVVTLPDETTLSVTPSNPSVGTYVGSFEAEQEGHHSYVWTATGTVEAVEADVFEVFGTAPRRLISLADARQALNLRDGEQTDANDEIKLFIAAAGVVIAKIDREYVAYERTYKTAGGRGSIVLPNAPILSVTSIENRNGSDISATAYAVNESAGIVEYLSGSWPTMGTSPSSTDLTVTYTVGDTSVPANVILAARELVRHWWQRGQQGTRPNWGGTVTDGEAQYVAGYAVPNFVIGILQPDKAR